MILNSEAFENTVHSILLILKKLGGKADFHKVFKIMYFADQKHLVKFGSSISNDNYIAMENGPVPSIAYDILKALKGDGLLSKYKEHFIQYFNLVNGYTVEARMDPDLENLSLSEIGAIEESLEENKDLGFIELKDKSHDSAWSKADKNGVISIIDIAIAGGANDSMTQYIQNHQENLFAKFE